MTKSPQIWLLIVAALTLILGALFFMAGGPDEVLTRPVEKPSLPLAAESRTVTDSASTLETVTMPLGKPANPAAPTNKEQIIALIDDVAVSYDPKELPKIQPYLLNPDPEVRQAALNGMIVLGDAAASPILRSTAKLAITPEEAVAMNEAAAYLELPSGSMLHMKSMKKNKK